MRLRSAAFFALSVLALVSRASWALAQEAPADPAVPHTKTSHTSFYCFTSDESSFGQCGNTQLWILTVI